jgi:hypothetical protein
MFYIVSSFTPAYFSSYYEQKLLLLPQYQKVLPPVRALGGSFSFGAV